MDKIEYRPRLEIGELNKHRSDRPYSATDTKIRKNVTSIEAQTDFNNTTESIANSPIVDAGSITPLKQLSVVELEENMVHYGITQNLKLEIQRTYQNNNRLPILVELTSNNAGVNDELMQKAKRLINLLTEKKNLKNAISQKEAESLKKTLKRIETKGLKDKLKNEYEEGFRLLARLQKSEQIRHEVITFSH